MTDRLQKIHDTPAQYALSGGGERRMNFTSGHRVKCISVQMLRYNKTQPIYQHTIIHDKSLLLKTRHSSIFLEWSTGQVALGKNLFRSSHGN